MGRGARSTYYITRYGVDLVALPKDRKAPGETVQQLIQFAESSPGPVASALFDRQFLRYNAAGQLEVDPVQVRREIENIKIELVSTREEPKERIEQLLSETLQLPTAQAWRVETHTQQARVQAIYAAAKAAQVDISPAEKRILNPIKEGRYLDVLYGKQGQYEGGTLATRVAAQRKTGRLKFDPRAAELRESYYEYVNERRGGRGDLSKIGVLNERLAAYSTGQRPSSIEF